MTAKRKRKPAAKPTQPVFRQPTVKEAEAITHASNRLSQRRKRVQVKIELANGVASVSHTHSDGQGRTRQLTDAFGTTSHEFANLLLTQASNALSVPEASAQETMNGVLAAVDGAQPKDEIEAMLVSQMAVTHSLAMEFLGRAKRAEYLPQLEASGNLAVKLLRTYTLAVSPKGGAWIKTSDPNAILQDFPGRVLDGLLTRLTFLNHDRLLIVENYR
jgi:hypothetical protein